MMTTRPATRHDAANLAPRLRAADVAELKAATGATPLEGLQSGFKVSEICMVAEIDGEVISMFGVARDDEVNKALGLFYGNVWFLGSPESVSDAKFFMRESRAWLKTIGVYYDALGNAVDARNTKHVKWIKAMGFEFIDTFNNYGPEGHTFLRFYKTCEGLQCAKPL
jgi:hypothetical protein